MPRAAPYYLRISLGAACGFRCPYCLPEGHEPGAVARALSPVELERVVAGLVRAGVTRVRLTGGEPLLRADCIKVVERLAGIEGLQEVALTTNGERLAEQTAGLWAAGLARVNVHLDTLRAERFRRLTGRDGHARVLAGIRAVQDAGLLPLKANVVLMRGINDDEILDFCAWGAAEGVVVRFIELMDTGPARAFVGRHFLPGEEARRIMAERYDLTPRFEGQGGSPSREYLLDGGPENGGAVVGFIEPESAPFCGACNRLRLDAAGLLRTCLYGGPRLDLAALLRRGLGPEEMAGAMQAFLDGKRSGHPALTGEAHARFSMACIGG